jgi:hypothetical protein
MQWVKSQEIQCTKAFPPIHQGLLLLDRPNRTAHSYLQRSTSHLLVGRFRACYMSVSFIWRPPRVIKLWPIVVFLPLEVTRRCLNQCPSPSPPPCRVASGSSYQRVHSHVAEIGFERGIDKTTH